MTSEYFPNQENNKVGLPYDLSYIPDDFKKKAKLELFEDEDTRVHSLKLFRTMLASETQLHWQDDDLFLLAFLRARKFDVKRAFNLMKTFYAVMAKRSELYQDFDFNDVRRSIKDGLCGFLPYRDHEGCVVLVIRADKWKPQEVSMGDGMRALTCGLLVSILSPVTQIAGFKVIFDLSDISLSFLPYVSPSYLWLFAEALQNCFPGRFRAIHMVNEGLIWSQIWMILKQFLTKKLKDRFHFHGKNVKKLHKYFPPSILPAEYEGELPPFDNASWRQRVEECSDYLTYVFSHGYKKKKTKAEEKSSTSN